MRAGIIPYPIRVALVALRREPELARFRRRFRVERSPERATEFRYELAAHESPLRRDTIPYDEATQRGKEINVGLVSGLLNGIVLQPGSEFSYHVAVGRPTRRRGFVPGPEMHRGKLELGLGGGSCAVSNMLYLLALEAGMAITERHRHGLDLFPDHGRTVPFGCGATVFYNQADLRFANPLSVPIMVSFVIEDGALKGRVLTPRDPGVRFEIYELDHRIEKSDEGTFRENRIRRKTLSQDGIVLADEEVAHNRGKVLYDIGDLP